MNAVSSGAAEERSLAEALARKINDALARIPDAQWNYSRLRVAVKNLSEIRGPYALGCDWLDHRTKAGQQQLQDLQREIEWGERHGNELSFLELASLRINRALLSVAGPTSDYWGGAFPVLRVATCEQLRAAGSRVGLWYEVEEVEGEELKNR